MRCVVQRRISRLISRPSYRTMTALVPPKHPLILILGATGTGKSNLAIQIAQALSLSSPGNVQHAYEGAEIVNADAMQLYRGLPIITNKVTLAEQQGIPHHLLDHIGLEEEPWTVQQYVKEADRAVEDIRSRNKLPIVVGGTSYYVYGMLFKNAMLNEQRGEDQSGEPDEEEAGAYGKDAALEWPILKSSTADIYAKLQEVDPEQAIRWHPNDRRKIQRSLEIYLRTGQKASEVYEKQRARAASQPSSSDTTEFQSIDIHETNNSPLRYDPIIFWLESENKILKDRLERRVDSMVASGLLDEAKDMAEFEKVMREKDLPLDKTKGIWVSIGYKEIEPWITQACDHDAKETDLEKLRVACIEAVKAGTRQYAKRQNRFIRLRLANALTEADAIHRLFLLDCTNLDRWQELVLQPSLKIVDSFLNGEDLPKPSGLSQLAQETFCSMTVSQDAADRVARRCDTCDKVLMTEQQWVKHLNSRSHKKVLEGIRRRQTQLQGDVALHSSHAIKSN